jgi:hypothetical protein
MLYTLTTQAQDFLFQNAELSGDYRGMVKVLKVLRDNYGVIIDISLNSKKSEIMRVFEDLLNSAHSHIQHIDELNQFKPKDLTTAHQEPEELKGKNSINSSPYNLGTSLYILLREGAYITAYNFYQSISEISLSQVLSYLSQKTDSLFSFCNSFKQMFQLRKTLDKMFS